MRAFIVASITLAAVVTIVGCWDYPIGYEEWDDWDEWDDDGVWGDGDADPDFVSGGDCTDDTQCHEGSVCSPYSECEAIVLRCPLTDECLGDPVGHVDEDLPDPETPQPTWQGTDPVFVGTVSINDEVLRVMVDLDFYDDHLYGEGIIAFYPDPRVEGDWLHFYITGNREGAFLSGQVIEQEGRTFDAMFIAELHEASEISGTIDIANEEGEFTGSFHLFRTSPCGCEIEGLCTSEADCDPGFQCISSECVECVRNHDCPDGMICTDGTCMEQCEHECCGDGDCVEGSQCVDNVCSRSCEARCDCLEGEICGVDGFCEIPTEPPSPECSTDCDCDYAAGERCLEGICRL